GPFAGPGRAALRAERPYRLADGADLLRAEEARAGTCREDRAMSTVPARAALGGSHQPEPPAVPDRPLLVALLAAVFLLATAITLLHSPDGAVVSADPGYAPRPVPLLLVPALAAALLTVLLPRGTGRPEAVVRRPRAVRAETTLLLALVLAFPLLVPLLPLPEDYVLLKVVMFLLVPTAVLALSARRAGPRSPSAVPPRRGGRCCSRPSCSRASRPSAPSPPGRPPPGRPRRCSWSPPSRPRSPRGSARSWCTGTSCRPGSRPCGVRGAGCCWPRCCSA